MNRLTLNKTRSMPIFKKNYIHFIIISILAFSVTSKAQDILSAYEGLVDPLTGDFRWSQNLISIESSGGESYPISIGYSAEVKTNQPASWVGLGWNLNGGEIVRQVNGFPDDHTGFTQTETKYSSGTNVVETTAGWGPMYFTSYSYGNNNTQDIQYSTFSRTTAPALTPAFDDFMLSSSFQSGSFHLDNYQLEENQIAAKRYEKGNDGNGGIGWAKFDNPDANHNFNFRSFQLENDPFRNTYITYYTNGQIETIKSNNPTTYSGFKEYTYEAGGDFDRSNLDPEEIGAFTVIMSNGTRLHFSLPVYEISSKTILVKVGDDGSLSTDTVRVIEKNEAFVTSWKLTAITGPDYRGADLHEVQEGDTGFWLKFYYAKWFDTKERTPEYGFNNNPTYSKNKPYEVHRPFLASASVVEKENYYLDRIESDREALVFYKSIRNDEYANLAVGTGKAPALKIDRIIRYYKEGLSISKNNSISTPTNLVALNSNTTERNKAYLNVDYNTANNSKVIKGVALSHDYSLQPSYYRNINNYSTSHESSATDYQLHYSGETLYQVPNTFSNTKGKLTLTSITLYENEFTQMFSPFNFTYASGSSNPNHHHWNNDLTGNYLNVSSRRQVRLDNNYTATSSTDYWKLKQVNYPNGTVLKVNYEMDQYDHKYNGFNDSQLIIPVKNIKNLAPINGSVTLDIELFDAYDKQLITAKANRKISFSSSFLGCDDHLVSDPTYSAFGLATYNDQGGVDAALTSITFGTNSNPDELTLTMNFDNLNADPNATNQSDCGSSFQTNPTSIKFMRFLISDPTHVVPTHRVKDLEVYESSSATDHYTLSFDYELGYATSNLSDAYIKSNGAVDFGNRNTSFNSLPFSVLYKYTTINKKGIDGSPFYKSKLTHNIIRPFTVKSYRSNGKENQCYIPISFLRSSVKELWKKMHEDDYKFGDFPELITCGIRTYIEEILIPQSPTLSTYDINDWEKVYNTMREGNFFSFGIADAGSLTIGCNANGIHCDGKAVDNSITNPDRYLYFSSVGALNNRITYSTEVRDNTSKLGALLKVETFDGDENLVLQTDYHYDVKAITNNEYKARHGKNTAVASITNRTLYQKEYHYPKRKYIFSKGLRYTEEILELHPTTGLPVKILYSDPSKGITEEYKEFLVDIDPLSDPGARAAAKTQLGIENGLGDLVKTTRIFWQAGESRDSEHNALNDKHNILDAVFASESNLYGNRIGHELFSGTDDLDLLNTTRVEVDYSGALQQLANDYTYTSIDLNPSSNSIFDPVSIETEGFVASEKVSDQKITLVNDKLNPLETYESYSDIYTSTKYKLNGEWPFVSASNTRYGSFTATGFEDQVVDHSLFEGEVTGSAARYLPTTGDITQAHTGKYVCRVNNASPEVAFISTTQSAIGDGGVLESGRTYISSVWVNNQSYSGTPTLSVSLEGSANNNTVSSTWSRNINHADNLVIGNWTLIEVEFTVPENYVSVELAQGVTPQLKIALTGAGSGYTYYDDFRFHPIEVPLEVTIYDDQYMRATEVLDADNQYTKLEYDKAGRVIRKWRESVYGVYTAEELTYND